MAISDDYVAYIYLIVYCLLVLALVVGLGVVTYCYCRYAERCGDPFAVSNEELADDDEAAACACTCATATDGQPDDDGSGGRLAPAARRLRDPLLRGSQPDVGGGGAGAIRRGSAGSLRKDAERPYGSVPQLASR